MRLLRPVALALPGLSLFVLGQFHPMHLTYATSRSWWVLHVVGLFLFPLVALALAALVRGRRDAVAVLTVLLAYGFATAYSALDVIAGIAAGYVTERLGPGVPRPPEVGSLFHVGNQLGWWGALALVLAALVLVADALWRHRVRALPAVLMLPGAYLVQTHHIYHPLGAAGMALVGLATGWLAWTARGPQNSRSDGSSMPRSAS